MGHQKPGEPITIKKYANRRLYNTATSSYVTLDHLCDMVKEGQDFVVYDAKSGEDITRSVLTQIIVEQEAKGENLLPIHFLRQLISYYDDQMKHVVPGYLDMSMDALAQRQDEFRERMTEAMGSPAQGMRMFEEMTRANIAMFQNTWGEAMQNMMGMATGGAMRPGASDSDKQKEIDALKAELAAMQAKLNEMAK